MDHATTLSRMVLPDRFEITIDPLGWRCRSCGASRSAVTPNGAADDATDGAGDGATDGDRPPVAVTELAEAAADHGLECGRCSD